MLVLDVTHNHLGQSEIELGLKGATERPRVTRAGQGRAGQGRAGQGRAGQGRAGQGRAGQGRAGQGQGRAGRELTTINIVGPWMTTYNIYWM